MVLIINLYHVNFSRADLTNDIIVNADLRESDLSGAELTGADLTSATLTDVIDYNPPSGGIILLIVSEVVYLLV